MTNIFTGRDVKKIQKQVKRNSQFSYSDRRKATEAIDNLVGQRKGGEKANRIINKSGLSSSDRRGIIGMMDNNSRRSSAPSRIDKNSVVSPNKPKTSWWQALKGGGAKSQGSSSTSNSFSNLRSRAGNPSFTNPTGSGNSVRPGFTNRGDGLGRQSTSSGRGSSTTSSRPHISLKS